MLNASTGETQTQQQEACKVMMNPFIAGQTVIIPAGTIYLSQNPSVIGRQKTSRALTAIIETAIPAKAVKGANGRCIISPARVRIMGTGGHLEDVNLTEAILFANNKQPEYELLHNEGGTL